MPGRRTHYLLPLLAAGLLSCAELPTIEEDRCGNGFIEAGEDCDAFGATAKDADPGGTAATCNAPGTPNQCRFQCETSEQCQSAPVSSADPASKLASGWRCGVDHVCRRPEGDNLGEGEFFESVTSLVPGSADDLFTGDFDGDGRADVLAVGSAGFDVHYFTRDGGLAKTASVPTAPVIPAIGKLTSSAADDFTLDVGLGIGVMLGQLGQTVEPTSYLSLDIKKRYKQQPPDDMVFFTLDTGEPQGPKPVALIRADDDVRVIDAAANPEPLNPKVLLANLPGLGKLDLIGRVPVASLVPGSHQQRFALAYRDSPAVVVLTGVFGAKAIESAVALPPGLTVHGAAFFLDVDGDLLTDLVVGGAKCGAGLMGCSAEIDVAYGNGLGQFYAAPSLNGVFDVAGEGHASPYLEVYAGSMMGPGAKTAADLEPYLPLAVGKLNTDVPVDYVTSFGIYVSDPSGAQGLCGGAPKGYCRAESPSGGEVWTDARIADFNGNTRPDVAAVSSTSRGIDLFSGTGTGVFNTFAIPTEGTPRSLTVGDFDGDFVGDLAFDSVVGEMGADVHTLFVAFGRSSGGPELPRSMGVVENLHQIAAGDLNSFGTDAATDLMLLSGSPAIFGADGKKTSPGGGWKAGLAQGNGYRQLSAPLLFFSDGTIDVESVPLASAIGFFDSDPAPTDGTPASPAPHADLAAVTTRVSDALTTSNLPPFCALQANLWLLPATLEAAIEPPDQASRQALIAVDATAAKPVPEPFFPVRRLVEATPIKVSGTGTDQLLIAFPTYKACSPGQQPNDIGAHGELFLATFGGQGAPTLNRVKSLDDAAAPGEFFVRLRVGDINGDGFPDVAAIKARFDFKLGGLDDSTAVVLLGDGAGNFADPIPLDIPGLPLDLTLVNTDDRGDAEIVVVVDDASAEAPKGRLFVFDWDETKKASPYPFKTLLPRGNVDPTMTVGGPAFDNPAAIAGGDFDGDGVDDVAVAVAGGVQIFKGVAK